MNCPNDGSSICKLPERIAELEAELKQSEIVIQAKMDVIEELQAEGKRALEHIDNLSAINRDLREKLEQRRTEERITGCEEPDQGPKPVVELQCVRCGGKTFKSTADRRLQCIGCDSLGPFERVPRTGAHELAPKRGSTQQRIAERRQKENLIRRGAHLYLQNGPAEQSFRIHTADDMEKAIKALLHAACRGKALQVIIQEAV